MAKKSWLALGGFWLVFAALAALLYLPNRTARQDAEIWRTANIIGSTLDGYVHSKNKIPDNLAEVGSRFNVPPTVSYHKDSDTAYTFCVAYQQAGTVKAGAYSTANPDYLVVPGKHTAGKNCVTVQPKIAGQAGSSQQTNKQALTESADGHTLVCGTQVNKYVAYGPLLGLNPTDLYLNNMQTKTSVTMVKINYSQIPGDAGATSYMYGPGSKAYDASCKELAITDLKVDDNVGVYDIYSEQSGAVSIFLKQ